MAIRKNGPKVVDCHCSIENAMMQLEPLRYQCNRCHWIVCLAVDSVPKDWWQGNIEAASSLYPFCENCQAQMKYESFGYWDEDNRYFRAFLFSCCTHPKERRISLYVEEVSAQDWNEISRASRQTLMDSLIENSPLQKFLDEGLNNEDKSYSFRNRVVSIEYSNSVSFEDQFFWEYLKNNGIIFNLSFRQTSVTFSLAEDFLERYKSSKSLMATRGKA